MKYCPFFITGLPRSGTAWLANLFTVGGNLCYHEPIEGIEELVANHTGKRVGISDSTLLLRTRELRERFPAARWLVVDRPRQDALQSFCRFTGSLCPPRPLIERLFDLMEFGARSLVGQHRIDFDRLGDEQTVARAFHALLGEAMDVGRYRILSRLNVQQHITPAALKERGLA